MSRIEELEKRIAADPNSRMFVQLAEEYRKAGLLEQAIDVCQEGLKKHPQYPSARVALGRALLEAGSLDRAGEELEAVLKAVPDNIVANKFLGETYHRLGRLEDALKKYQVAKTLAPEDAELDGKIQEVEREIAGGGPPAAPQAPAPQAPSPPPPVPVPEEAASAAPEATLFEGPGGVEIEAPAPVSAGAESSEGLTEAEQEHAPVIEDLAPIPLVEVDEPMILETRDYVPPVRGETTAAPAPAPAPATSPEPAPAPEPMPEPPATFDQVEPEPVFEPEFEMPAPLPSPPSPAPAAPPPPKPAPAAPPAATAAPAGARPVTDIETPTMAEIYANQGHFDQAIAVYRKILERSPNEHRYHERIEELEMLASASSGPASAEQAPRPSAPRAGDSRERTIQVLEQWLAAIRQSRGGR